MKTHFFWVFCVCSLSFVIGLDNYCSLPRNSGRNKHALMIGIDGLGAMYTTKEYFPHIWEDVLERGSWTLDARNVRPTDSKPNWAALLMGARPEETGITGNGWSPPESLNPSSTIMPSLRSKQGKDETATSKKIFPSIYRVIKEGDKTMTTAHLTDHDIVVNLVDNYETDVDAFAYFDAKHAEMVDWFENCVSDETTVPDFAFLHFDGVDHAGHSYVWGSENQRKAMQDADYHISRVFNLYKKLSVWNETLVMIVSDHGGYAFGHGGDRTTDVLVPWMVAGPGIQKQELLTFVRSEDSSPTILRFLGIQAPNAWTGRVVEEIFDSSLNQDQGLYRLGGQDPCPQLIGTCKEIKGTDCGWCDSSGKAMMGQLIGPFKGKCDKWIWANTFCP